MMLVLEKIKSPVNTAFESVVDKHTVNFWLQKLNPLWSMHEPLGKITKKQFVSSDMLSLDLQVNRHFDFGLAGQHHPVYVVVDGVRYERSYSLTRLDDKHVQINVKKVTDGKVSTWLHEQAEVGDIIEFGLPFGDMTVNTTAQPLVLLAAGSGITPMLSMIQEMQHAKRFNKQAVHLLYWVKTEADAAFKAQFEAFASQYQDFTFEIFYTQAGDQRLNSSHIERIADLAQSTVYACGPSGFVLRVEELCANAQSLKTEAFSLTELASDDVGFVNVTLTKSNKVLTIPKGQPILSSLEQQNVKPNHGCRMGICNKCACNKVEGSTRNLVNGIQNKEPGNLLKICVNSAQTDLVIDL